MTPEEVEAVIIDFENEARKLGMYLQAHMVASTDGHHHDDAAEGDLMVMCTFMIGEQAFSDRILNPEKHEEDQEFREMIAQVDPMQQIREEMQRKIDNGEDPF